MWNRRTCVSDAASNLWLWCCALHRPVLVVRGIWTLNVYDWPSSSSAAAAAAAAAEAWIERTGRHHHTNVGGGGGCPPQPWHPTTIVLVQPRPPLPLPPPPVWYLWSIRSASIRITRIIGMFRPMYDMKIRLGILRRWRIPKRHWGRCTESGIRCGKIRYYVNSHWRVIIITKLIIILHPPYCTTHPQDASIVIVRWKIITW